MALSNRQLLLREEKKKKALGLPEFITKPRKAFSTKVDRPAPKKTGIQTRGLEPQIKEGDIGLATKGIADTSTALARQFPQHGFETKDTPSKARFTNTFQGKPITNALSEDIAPGTAKLTVSEGQGLTGTELKNIQASAGVGLSKSPPRQGGLSSFGLPTDRLPTFAELGGAIGQMFKHLGGISKKRQALGLIPGKVNVPTVGKGLSLTDKDRATILTKRLEDLTLTDDERTSIKSELDNILHPARVDEATDIEDILNE